MLRTKVEKNRAREKQILNRMAQGEEKVLVEYDAEGNETAGQGQSEKSIPG